MNDATIPITYATITRASTHILRYRHPTPQEIIHRIVSHVSYESGVTQSEIYSPVRTDRIARARQIVMFLARELAGLSYATIGDELGKRDHGTVMHGHRAVRERMDVEPVTRKQVTKLMEELR